MFATVVFCMREEIDHMCSSVSDPTSAIGGPIYGISSFGVLALWSHQRFQLPPDLGIKFSRQK